MQLDNKAIGEIIEINEKSAVIALGGLMTTVKTDRLTKVSNSAAKKIAQNKPQRSSSPYLENISQKRKMCIRDRYRIGTHNSQIRFSANSFMINS